MVWGTIAAHLLGNSMRGPDPSGERQRDALSPAEHNRQRQDEHIQRIMNTPVGDTYFWDKPKDITEEVNKLKEPKRIE